MDPLIEDFPSYSPYQYAGNQPIRFIDLDGLEEATPRKPSPMPVLSNPTESVSSTSAFHLFDILKILKK